MLAVDWTRRIDNRLLQALSPHDLDEIRSHITRVPLVAEHVITRQGEPLQDVLFIEDGLISIQAEVGAGLGHVEVGLIGCEGLIDMSALLLDEPFAMHRTVVHVSGAGLRMPVAHLRACMDRTPEFRHACQQYVVTNFGHLSQSIVCNSRHNTTQRCARWLLSANDRVPNISLPLRQTLLAQMLAVHRPGVSAALRTLQDQGSIHQQRGRIDILDRELLERSACECYAQARAMHAILHRNIK
jgi:CRP-like cAMP-binding protein